MTRKIDAMHKYFGVARGTWFGHDCYEISNFCPNCGADIREEGE